MLRSFLTLVAWEQEDWQRAKLMHELWRSGDAPFLTITSCERQQSN
jgi:hypothetical protein